MRHDAVVVGSGPNGLAAAITFAQAGRSVLVLEEAAEVGGGLRSGPLVGEGYVNDLGSAIHPLGRASPFLSTLDLQAHGLEWVVPPAAVAHPLDGGRAAIAWSDLDKTVAGLGHDGPAYRAMAQPLITGFDKLLDLTMRPVLRVPPHPLFAVRFGLQAIQPATILARRRFGTEEGQALFAGHAAHSVLPLSRPLTSSFGLLFAATPHVVGWPFPRGGAASLAAAMAAVLRSLGGEIRTGVRVRSLADLPAADRVVFALTTMQVLAITGAHFPARFRKSLAAFRYGPGVFKLDYALSGPIPWTNPDVAQAGCVHVGGTLAQVAASESAVGRGHHAARPFAILAQPSSFDPSRAPQGHHTCWVYCHVPHGSTVDMTTAIEDQIERFAPGFRDLVIRRHTMDCVALQRWNASLIGGDIGGGSLGGAQLLARPRWSPNPYATPDPRLFIGSASTPPGGGVHGMAGHQAALAALR